MLCSELLACDRSNTPKSFLVFLAPDLVTGFLTYVFTILSGPHNQLRLSGCDLMNEMSFSTSHTSDSCLAPLRIGPPGKTAHLFALSAASYTSAHSFPMGSLQSCWTEPGGYVPCWHPETEMANLIPFNCTIPWEKEWPATRRGGLRKPLLANAEFVFDVLGQRRQ